MNILSSILLSNDLNNLIKICLQIIILSYIIFLVWRRIKGTQAEGLLKGAILLILFIAISYLAKLTLITSIIQHLIPFTLLAIVVIFQPEIRKGLNYLGRLKTFNMDINQPENFMSHKLAMAREQIIQAVRELSRTRIGALIVVEAGNTRFDYLSPGVKINADLTSLLLLSLFYPNSPLHDGAVIIKDNKIISAGVLLPMTESLKLSHRYGTRHRAAVGLSELYDGICIVVSEETGSISVAQQGVLTRVSKIEELKDLIAAFFDNLDDPKSINPLNNLWTLFSRNTSTYNAKLLNSDQPTLASKND